MGCAWWAEVEGIKECLVFFLIAPKDDQNPTGSTARTLSGGYSSE